jgi:predicted dehydrogenase
MEKKLGMCVVGLGMGYSHAQTYSELKGVNLYLCDVNKDRLATVAKKMKPVGIFNSIDEALASLEVDALDTALPHYLHASAALQTFNSGKHFATEKPIARTLQEADEMIAAAQQANRILMIMENQRFWPVAIRAKEIIDQGLIGKPLLIDIREMWHIQLPLYSWRKYKEKAGGGNLIDSGIHAVNTLRLLGGEVDWVFAQTRREVLVEIEAEDTALIQVRFRNGAIGNLITSWGTRVTPNQPRFSIIGTEASLWNPWNTEDLVYKYANDPIKTIVETYPKANNVALECQHFVESILQDKKPITSGEEGRKDLEIVLASYQSAEKGMPIKISS